MKRSYSSFSASASSSSEPRIDYDVFLSFRGEDTRYGFTGHLYNGLDRKGIHTFKDDNDLERGQPIYPELLKTIGSSRCSVVVLSRNYASSSWCLDELAKILQCMKDYKQIVLPIFYHVDPSHVRKQIGSFGEAFEKHVFSQNPDLEKVRSWRNALTEVSNLAGRELRNREDEAEFIEKVSKDVSEKLDVGVESNILEDLVGMDSRVKALDDLVCPSSVDHDVRFIGICGMGGIGKTTLAKVYYEQMSSKFQGSSFLANVREVCEKKYDGLEDLQNRLFLDILKIVPEKPSNVATRKDMIKSNLQYKKVLIVLDGVGKLDHLGALAGKGDWFGSGSRIIITTRDVSLLISTYKDCRIYRPEQLNDSEGLQLFSRKAFIKSSDPSEDYTELSKQVIAYANGLPYALQVLGSFLCGKTINEWRSALDRLKEYPKKEIVKVLQVTFDGLEETEKSLFLDIACFFNGFDKYYIIQIMDSCGFHPTIGIRTLIDKSLIHIDRDNRLRMHDLLQEMAKEIVREKSRKEPGRWSRIWDFSDFQHVMEKNTGTEQVEAIVVYSSDASKVFNWEALSNMVKLRLLSLRFYNAENVLWHKFPFTCFQPDELDVELKLSVSSIEHKPMKPLNSLKVLDLGYSWHLRKFENFGVVPNLEKLILSGCSGLVEVHPSITLLTSLALLDLSFCTRLENLPTSIKGLKSLQVLKLCNCFRLRKLPEDLGHLNSLEELHLRSTNVSCGISTHVFLKNFKKLSCGASENMMNIIVGKGLISGYFCSLKKLDLSNCNLGDGSIPEDFGCLASLEELNLGRNYFSSLPARMNELSKLRILDLRWCEKLKSLAPELPPSLEMVRTEGCCSLDTFLDPLNDQCDLMRCSATCFNCIKLVRRQGSKKTAFASLKRYLQNPAPNPSKQFFIVLPGKEIPTWFTSRSSGRSISLKVDPNWCSSKWMGFAFSVITPADDIPIRVRINVQELEFELPKYEESGSILQVMSNRDHLWLIYVPRDICFHTKWQTNCSPLEFSFEFPFDHLSNDTYECGVRLVYEQDIQDLNEDVDVDADGEGDGDSDADTDGDEDGDSDADHTDGDVQGNNEASNWR